MSNTPSIRRMLFEEGLSLGATAVALNLSVDAVRSTAARYDLPYNRPIPPRGLLERQILRSLVVTNMNIPLVAALYRQAPVNIRALIDRLRSDESTLSSPLSKYAPDNQSSGTLLCDSPSSLVSPVSPEPASPPSLTSWCPL